MIVGGEHAAPEHTPDRPSWTCRACRQPWPCDPARKSLREQYTEDPTVTALYLSSQQQDYLDDTPNYEIDHLYERFFAWVR
jgi:hypothetical protein